MGSRLCAFSLKDLPTHADMQPRFARPVPQLCMISDEIMNYIYETQHHRLRSFDQLWLSPENLQNYANVIHAKGAPLNNCWVLLTVRCDQFQDQENINAQSMVNHCVSMGIQLAL